MSGRVFLLEDDHNLGPSLKSYIEKEGFEVTLAKSIEEAKALLTSTHEILILDWMLPDGQGLDFLKERRRQSDPRPMIMLTARTDLVDKVIGLESGANDYITKPFEPRELIARVRVQIRDQKNEELAQEKLIFKNIVIDLKARRVLDGEQEIDLTKMEFELLTLLCSSPDRVFGREEILNKVWGYENYPTTRTVDTHILQLRQKVEGLDIDTIRGVGYRLRP